MQNIGVEKVYLIHSPRINYIKITRKSKIRKAKLYYLRNKSGKETRLKQKFI
uniref:Ribosomal protein L19 n=1 Tax=Dicranema revolutum TaxID=239144 RepID=A0A4D6WV96_9FLOR|nr:ribosomal protein L19 [Dicranema revolutum]